MSIQPPQSPKVANIEGEAWRVGSEMRWSVQLVGGGRGVLAMLLPELAREEAIRRRYTGDLERRARVTTQGVAALLDRSGSDETRPWRLRAAPQGTPLSTWLEQRSPAPIDEVAALGASLAEVLHRLHREGVVVRDLHPRAVILTDDGPVLTDVGLARVDLLSTRTAASLVLEGSPYASPEQLRKTILDQRSDLYGLGVMLWQALTGTLPYGEEVALLADPSKRPALRTVRAEVPGPMAACIEACLSHDVEARPSSASEVTATLRGEGVEAAGIARVVCQSCGARLLQGQRLCLECGKQGVVFRHREGQSERGYELVLRSMKEDAAGIATFRDKLAAVGEGELPAMNFVSGDARMYSKAERKRGIVLPKLLFTDLPKSTAEALRQHLQVTGSKFLVRRVGGPNPVVWIIGVVVALFAGGMALLADVPVLIGLALMAGVMAVTTGISFAIGKKTRGKPPLLELRKGPAALPASDPWVARLAALNASAPNQAKLAPDVRERLGQLALSVQRLVDHRAALPKTEQREVDVVTSPLESLMTLLEEEVARVVSLDTNLAALDEGELARQLASAAARGDAKPVHEEILANLDRLRSLEDARAAALHRLLEASVLMRRAVELGLRVKDPTAHHQAEIALALAALGGGATSGES